jgi:pimeloyl-ACP methyl ester carboxylesterase
MREPLVALLVGALTLTAAVDARPPVEPDPISIVRTGSGTPLVFLPGLGCPGSVWDRVVAELSKTHTCVVVSIAGFAGQQPLSPPDIQAIRSAIARVAAGPELTRGDRKPVLIGHSLGGSLAIAIAASKPDLFSRLVVVDAYPFPLAVVQPGVSAAQAASQAAAIRDLTLKQTATEFEAQQAAVLRMQVSNAEDANTVARWVLSSDRPTLAAAQEEVLSRDLRPELSKIRLPVLVVGTWKGREMLGFSRTMVEQQLHEQYGAAALPTFSVTDTARHFVMLDDPTWLVAQVRAFLGE